MSKKVFCISFLVGVSALSLWGASFAVHSQDTAAMDALFEQVTVDGYIADCVDSKAKTNFRQVLPASALKGGWEI